MERLTLVEGSHFFFLLVDGLIQRSVAHGSVALARGGSDGVGPGEGDGVAGEFAMAAVLAWEMASLVRLVCCHGSSRM